jgi:hypothetical protein
MIIYKHPAFGYCITKRLNDYNFRRFYHGYTLAEAKARFRADYKEQKNNEA